MGALERQAEQLDSVLIRELSLHATKCEFQILLQSVVLRSVLFKHDILY
jgi:hypothetical protein